MYSVQREISISSQAKAEAEAGARIGSGPGSRQFRVRNYERLVMHTSSVTTHVSGRGHDFPATP